jgi:GNAT superfamily N-acetyltransferase
MTSVRLATAADSFVIAPLLAQLGYDAAPDDIPRRISGVEAVGGVVFAAIDDNGQVVGVASATSYPTLHVDGGVAYITALVTDEKARGHGVGRALVEAIERWARSRGAARLSVTSAEHRDDAHKFYPRIGFPYTGRRFTKSLD